MTRHWLRDADGGPFRPAEALPLSDRGFRYGMAVFETLRVREGRVEFIGEHLWRLARACRASGFPVSPGALGETVRLLRQLAGSEAPGWTGVARVHVTAGDGGPADPPRGCRFLVSLEPRKPPAASLYRDGLRLCVHPAPHHPPFGGRKTHNYWGNVDALLTARRAGADEALLGDAENRLISVCLGNVFLWRDGRLLTPPTARGARAGILRARVIRLPGATVCDLGPDAWRAPGAAFLVTNSWLGAVPGFMADEQIPSATRQAVVEMARTVGGMPPTGSLPRPVRPI